MAKPLSPFRYPGSKASIASNVDSILMAHADDFDVFIEPYAGSASVSLRVLQSGFLKKVIIGERDPLLYSFWKVVFSNVEDLIQRIETAEITLDNWKEQKKFLSVEFPCDENIQDLAFSALYLNRTNFSGVLHSGPIGGMEQKSNYKIDCRFNKKDLIEKIISINKLSDCVDVYFGDAINLIKENSDNPRAVFYIDPPYFVQGKKLYRHHYKLQDHYSLAEALNLVSGKWFLSYDNHDVIEALYEGNLFLYPNFKYSTKAPKTERELLISNCYGFFSAWEIEEGHSMTESVKEVSNARR